MRRAELKKQAMDDHDMLDYLKNKLGESVTGDKSLILYGSETGKA